MFELDVDCGGWHTLRVDFCYAACCSVRCHSQLMPWFFGVRCCGRNLTVVNLTVVLYPIHIMYRRKASVDNACLGFQWIPPSPLLTLRPQRREGARI